MRDIDEPHADFHLIGDLRFENEGQAVLNRGGPVVPIERPGVPKSDDVADSALHNDQGFSHTIRNDGTLAQLREKVEKLDGQIGYGLSEKPQFRSAAC
jgi:hypothetical protein